MNPFLASVTKEDFGVQNRSERIRVFTTHVDTIFGATSVQLAPEHPLVTALAAADAGLKTQVAGLIDEQKKAKESGDIGAIEKHGGLDLLDRLLAACNHILNSGRAGGLATARFILSPYSSISVS